MKHLAILSLIILCSCSEKQSNDDHEPNDPRIENETNAEDSVVIDLVETIEIDSNLFALANHIKKQDWIGMNIKSHYRFDRDTVMIIDSIPFYSYEIPTLLDYYHNRSYLSDKRVEDIINLLSDADTCYGISTGGNNETENSMIEVFRLPTNYHAKQIELIYHKSYPVLFAKTLSFVKAIDDKLYVFHSRYMGASWYLKKDFEWFVENVANN